MLISKPKKKKPLTNLRLSDEDRSLIEAKARQYTKGNVSAWLRYAGINHTPPASALAKPEPKKRNKKG